MEKLHLDQVTIIAGSEQAEEEDGVWAGKSLKLERRIFREECGQRGTLN